MSNQSSFDFDRLLNFRDVGKTVNEKLRSRSLLAQGLLYRSARPDRATEDDRIRLRDVYGIKTVIDLRTKTEHLEQAQRLNLKPAGPHPLPLSNDDVAEPLRIPGLEYHLINLNGQAFERALFWKLSIWNRAKLLALMLLGYRVEAINIMGKEILQHRGLVGLGCDSIDYCGDEIRQVFDVLAERRQYPVLLHCTQGKDRTGLIVALVLFLLDVPIEPITHDYTLSGIALRPELEERMTEIRRIGLDESFASVPTDWVEKINAHLQKYGSVSSYLASIGVHEEAQERIKSILSGGST